MNAVRMEESVVGAKDTDSMGDYMKQVIWLGRVFGAAGGIASSMTNKAIQTAGQ